MSHARHDLLRTVAGLIVALLATSTAWGQYGRSPGYGYAPMPMAGPSGDYVPAHERSGQSYVAHGPMASPLPAESLGRMHTGEVIYEGNVGYSGEMAGDPHAACCDGSPCGDWACGNGCCGGLWGLLGRAFSRAEYYSGVASFSSPVNRGGTGSFGYETGMNLGGAMPCDLFGIGWQAGVAGTLTNLNGANFTHEDRQQLFATVGFFRRVDWGLQGGLVWDYLRDEWYANAELAQLRGELSWVVPEGRDFGFWFASGVSDDVVTARLQQGTAIPTTTTEHWEINNLYALFLRQTFAGQGQVRGFAGWTGYSGGLVGADAFLPLDDRWALRTAFTYVIPREGRLDGGHENEAWNVGLQIVFSPSCGTRSCDYYRPLFNVANNGNMIVQR